MLFAFPVGNKTKDFTGKISKIFKIVSKDFKAALAADLTYPSKPNAYYSINSGYNLDVLIELISSHKTETSSA